MKFPSFNGRVLMALTASVVAACSAVAGPDTGRPMLGPGHKIQVSEPSASSFGESNLTMSIAPATTQPEIDAGSFKQFQDKFLKPFKDAMDPVNSMQGVLSIPPPQQQEPDKHTRDLMEKRRNWAFTDIDELYPEPSLEQVFGIEQDGNDKDAKNGNAKQNMSILQKYYEYEKLGIKTGVDPLKPWEGQFEGARSASATNEGAFGSFEQPFSKNDPTQQGAFAETQIQDVMKKKDNFVGGRYYDPTHPEEKGPMTAAERHRMEFEKMLDPRASELQQQTDSMSGVMGINGDIMKPDSALLGMDNFTTKSPTTAVATLPQQPAYHNPLNTLPVQNDPNMAFYSHLLDNPTGSALGNQNPDPVKPVVAPAAPPKTAKSIAAMIDPFTAVMMKPKFQ